MPILKLVGGISTTVNQQQAISIMKARWGINGGQPTSNPTDPIEIDGVGIIQVKDVRAILKEDNSEKLKYNQAIEKNTELINKCKEYRERVLTWSPIKKAERMLKTYCYLCYRSKGNKGDAKDVMFQDPLYSTLMKPLVEFFENNPEEIHAPREIYEKLMPSIPSGRKEVEGWKTFADASR